MQRSAPAIGASNGRVVDCHVRLLQGGKDGRGARKTDWHSVVLWGKAAEHAGSLTKGARVAIEGKLQTRSWDGKDGKKQYKTEVVAFSYEELGGKPREVAQPQASQPGSRNFVWR